MGFRQRTRLSKIFFMWSAGNKIGHGGCSKDTEEGVFPFVERKKWVFPEGGFNKKKKTGGE